MRNIYVEVAGAEVMFRRSASEYELQLLEKVMKLEKENQELRQKLDDSLLHNSNLENCIENMRKDAQDEREKFKIELARK